MPNTSRTLGESGMRPTFRFINPADVAGKRVWLHRAVATSLTIPATNTEPSTVRAVIQFYISIDSIDAMQQILTFGDNPDRHAYIDALLSGPIGPLFVLKIVWKGKSFWGFSDATTTNESGSTTDLPF